MIERRELPQKANRVFSITSGPAVEPVTTDEVKLFARIDGSEEDSLISSFITAVRGAIEQYTWRALIEQSWRMSIDWWPGIEVELPRAPLLSVDGVYTVDEEDTRTEYDADNYYVMTVAEPGKLVIKDGATPPTNEDRQVGGFQIDFTCGYGSVATLVPEQLKLAIKMWATVVYETRAMSDEPPPHVISMLQPFRIIWY
jgi:uncharacterized phiE125 gp8 family phage protein